MASTLGSIITRTMFGKGIDRYTGCYSSGREVPDLLSASNGFAVLSLTVSAAGGVFGIIGIVKCARQKKSLGLPIVGAVFSAIALFSVFIAVCMIYAILIEIA